MIQVHERFFEVREAERDLEGRFLDWMGEHDLTAIEMLQCIQQLTTTTLKYALRAERHPDDEEKKGDEA